MVTRTRKLAVAIHVIGFAVLCGALAPARASAEEIDNCTTAAQLRGETQLFCARTTQATRITMWWRQQAAGRNFDQLPMAMNLRRSGKDFAVFECTLSPDALNQGTIEFYFEGTVTASGHPVYGGYGGALFTVTPGSPVPAASASRLEASEQVINGHPSFVRDHKASLGFLAGSAVGAGVATAFGLQAQSAANDLANARSQTDADASRARGQSAASRATATWIIAGALAALGVTFFALNF